MPVMERKDINVTLVALGCSKNLVDCECMSKLLKDAGYNVISDISDSDVAVINTCGFIESAKTEAISTILDVADFKEQGRLKYIVATGCLAQRYGSEVLDQLPEVDAVLGTAHYGDIVNTVICSKSALTLPDVILYSCKRITKTPIIIDWIMGKEKPSVITLDMVKEV